MSDKRSQLEQMAALRERLCAQPQLSWLFFELTNRCNLHCLHCGSSCTGTGTELSPETVFRVLRSVHDARLNPMIVLTGGEPMLHPQFFDIAEEIYQHGFTWGMTSNATLIDHDAADRLWNAGMNTVSVSLDGMEEQHDRLRCSPGSWKKAVRGIEALQAAGYSPQVTTVVHHDNLGELEEVHKLLLSMDIRSWRITNMDPIGRALGHQSLLLNASEFRQMIRYIQERRKIFPSPMEVTYGCAHYLGEQDERTVRDHFWYCGAGLSVASVRCNGDICGCLDIENRPELVQGSALHDDFINVWKNRFDTFRQDRTVKSGECSHCPDRKVCGGDSLHTWDFERHNPMVCGMKMMSGKN